ncbi:MAG: NAD-dependent protein deacylase [Lachnospiraceae bacterium]|nr:NAD-dependent protein deacylase [Lachnospiraceae bacterium]
MESFEERLSKLNDLIENSKNVVFFGGAGVSTESGIPDFRSKDGLYNTRDVQFEQYEPEYLLSNDCLYHDSKVFFEYYRQKMNVEGIEPNAAHKKLAELEAAGKLKAVITQNIDGLHQKAGSKKVYELHGTTERCFCDRCGKKFGGERIFKSEEPVPRCECGGMIRPEVTLYGEGLPEAAWSGAIRALAAADLFIVGGTSLTVYPANTMIRYYAGSKLVVINRDRTSYDSEADIVFRENIGEVMSGIRI